MSIRLSLKISVTIELIGFYYSENIPTGPVVVLDYFLGKWDTPNPPKIKIIPQFLFFFLRRYLFFPNFFSYGEVSSHKTTGGSTSSTYLFF